jgi:hypothetical protein
MRVFVPSNRIPWRYFQTPAFAALLALAAAAPGLGFPYLSDDWALLNTVATGLHHSTPYGDFRPLFMASLWLDHSLFALSPFFFHLTNIALLATSSALVVILARRFTQDDRIAGMTGILYAIHPYHVENAAWISARTEPLFVVFYLAAAISHERWLRKSRGIPLATILLFQAALLSKETALTLPLLLTLVALIRQPGGTRVVSWTRGYLVMWVQLALHFLFRYWALGGAGRTLLHADATTWTKHGLAYAVASIVPLPTEALLSSPVLWFTIAAGIAGLLLWLSSLHDDLPDRRRLGAVLAFVVVAGPSLVGLQERYFLLPSSVSAFLLSWLLFRVRSRLRIYLATTIIVFWTALLPVHWGNWLQAAAASKNLIAELSAVSRNPDLEEIIVVNMPFQIRGGSVAGDFRAALQLLQSRPIEVKAASYISYPSSSSNALARPAEEALRHAPSGITVRLQVPDQLYGRFIGPRPPPGSRTLEIPVGSLDFMDGGQVDVEIALDPDGKTAVLLWTAGRLVQINTLRPGAF